MVDADLIQMKTLRSTTSTHDDWLHRGPYLHDIAFHTYAEYIDPVRLPRHAPAEEQIFRFEPHYALARSYGQRINTPARIPVLEALRFVPPGETTKEENALYKHIVGSLLRCTCAESCSDPLLSHLFSVAQAVLQSLVCGVADSLGKHAELNLKSWPHVAKRRLHAPDACRAFTIQR